MGDSLTGSKCAVIVSLALAALFPLYVIGLCLSALTEKKKKREGRKIKRKTLDTMDQTSIKQILSQSPTLGAGCAKTGYVDYPNSQLDKDLMFRLAWNVTASNCTSLGQVPIPPNFDFSKRIEGSYVAFGSRRMYAYLFTRKRDSTVIIAFSGTEHLDEWWSDIDYSQSSPQGVENAKGKVHNGFYQVYLSIRDAIRKELPKGAKIHVSGYSLGGGVSQVCAMDLATFSSTKVRLWTFAAPRAWDPEGAANMDALVPNYTRVVNSEDIVPTLPTAVIVDLFDWDTYYYFSHCGQAEVFSRNLDSYLANHTTSYAHHFSL